MSLIGLVHIRTGKDFETIDRYFDLCSRDLKKSSLTHFQPMFHFYAPRKHVFRGYRSGTLVENGLILRHLNIYLIGSSNFSSRILYI